MASEVLSSPDLCSVVFQTLDESGLCACSAVCQAWREMARSDVLWKALADKGAEALGLCPGATAEQRSATGRMLETLGGGSAAAGGHRALLMRRKTKLPLTLCLDFGRGYAKYGFADSPKCAQLQICSPGAEACMQSFISVALHKLRRAESRSPGPTFTGGWPLAANSGAAAAAIVAEPFRLAADYEDEERRRFHLAVRRDLARWRVPRCSPHPASPPPCAQVLALPCLPSSREGGGSRGSPVAPPSSSAARDRPSPPLVSPRAGAAWSTPPPSCSSPTVS